ncbi:hypothetical protein TNCV_5081031 [Trichonephila clavipes]|nr:hypothetical protein TNCV_5081031 [Trichonephila clavipes]
MGTLVVRAPDSRQEGMSSMPVPPNTLPVHTDETSNGTLNKITTETVLFAGMCAHACETYVNPPFLVEQRASQKMATSEQKAFWVPQFAKTESAIIVYCVSSVPVDTSVDMGTLIMRTSGV